MQKNMMASKQHPASFRDPAGFIFKYGEKFYRQVNQCYAANYTLLKESGLYALLLKKNKLLAHTEVETCYTEVPNWYKTLLPDQLSFISYPYEWCFSQWKDAALLTLSLVKISVAHGMILKDATPFNVQFINGSPIWIDTLSFEKYDDAKPWIAYRQFVECFVAPLLLARYQSPELLKLFGLYPEGIPLKLMANLLPFRSRLNLNILMHIILPASLSGIKKRGTKNASDFSKQKLLRIVDNLDSLIQSLKPPDRATTWNNYYEETVLSSEYVNEKKACLTEWIRELPVKSVLDLGTNTGLFALLAAAEGKSIVAVDADIDCIDRLYNECKQNNISQLLPLCVDIANPTPSIGWDNQERAAFYPRCCADLCLALAFIHHLVISKNLGFNQLATTFYKMAPWLIIEFVPKTDPKISLLLQNREDIFEHYDEPTFTNAFQLKFTIEKKQILIHSGRILFLMKRKETAIEN
jgi:hypothetical protein